MKVVSAIAFALIFVPFWDWVVVNRLGAYNTSFDYRYWPLSKARLLSVLLLGVAIAGIGIFFDPDPHNPPILPIVIGGAALTIWAIVAVLDMNVQRRTGYRTPPRYSDSDY